MGLYRNLAPLLGVLIFLVILSRVDISQVILLFGQIEPVAYCIAIALLALLLILKGLKWKLILKSQGYQIGLLRASEVFTIGFFLSAVTPGKIGDFARAFYVRDIAPLPAALASVFLDRVIDVVILLIFSYFAAGYLASAYGVYTIPPQVPAIILVVSLAALFLLLREKHLKAIARPFFGIVVPQKMRSKMSAGFSSFFSSMRAVRKRPTDFVAGIGVTIVLWAISVGIFYFLAQSMHLAIPAIILLSIYPIVTLADLLPISFSGLGTREAILVFFFSFFALPAETAVAFSLLVFFTGYFLVALFGFGLFLQKPVKAGDFS